MSTEPRRRWHALALLLGGLTAGCAADVLRPAGPAAAPQETVTRELHPAGPTTLRVWRARPDAEPYRIEILRARSGRALVGQARLQRQADGTWVVQTSAGVTLALPPPGAGSTPVPTFREGGQTWSVRVTGQELPPVTPGIATEGEPALDLVLERQP